MQAALFSAMPFLLRGRWAGIASVLGMCLLMYVISTPVQVHALALAKREHPYAMNLCASTLSVAGNIGIALGSFASSELQAVVGMEHLGFPAAAVALAGLGLNLLLLRACRRG